MAKVRRVSLSVFRRRITTDSDFVVLAGAGISMIAPTSLPSGNALRDICIQKLLQDKISRRYLRRLMRLPSYHLLLPEVAFQEIAATLSKDLDTLMSKLLESAPPNSVHKELASRYAKIFTTNFDSCLEASQARAVVHLHGEITAPGTLQNRTFRLGKANATAAANFFRSARKKPLLVIGYSFRDDDVVELVCKARPSKIYFLSYDTRLPQAMRLLTIPWVVTCGSAEELFVCSPSRSSRQLTVGVTTTNLPSLARRANALIRLCFRLAQYDIAEQLAGYYMSRITGRPRYKFIAELANMQRLAGRYSEAISLANVLLRAQLCRKKENADIRSSAYVILGLCELDLQSHQFLLIEEYFLKGLQATREFASTPRSQQWLAEIQVWKARQFNNLGMLYSDWGNAAKAISYYERALKIKEQFHEDPGIAQTCANMARLLIVERDYRRACKLLERVVFLMEKSPDIFILKDTVAKIQSVFHPNKVANTFQRKRLQNNIRRLRALSRRLA